MALALAPTGALVALAVATEGLCPTTQQDSEWERWPGCKQHVCCGGCWCLIWLAAGSRWIWRDADQWLHWALRLPPKKSLEMAAGMEKELDAWPMYLPASVWWGCAGAVEREPVTWGLLVLVVPTKAIRPKHCRSWAWYLALFPARSWSLLPRDLLRRWLSWNKLPNCCPSLSPEGGCNVLTQPLERQQLCGLPTSSMAVSQPGGSPCPQVTQAILTHYCWYGGISQKKSQRQDYHLPNICTF